MDVDMATRTDDGLGTYQGQILDGFYLYKRED